MTNHNKWPKEFPPLTPEQVFISNDFMRHWHEVLANKYGIIEKFNHGYVVKNSAKDFEKTLEIGAGLGEHLDYENLSEIQAVNYVASDLRENMVQKLQERFPKIKALVANCQEQLPYEDGYFDRIIAIHVLEHLPNLPAAIKEMYRLCDKKRGKFMVVIPCEGGLAYSLARRISAQRVFEKRYKQSYKWLIEREHINKPSEILEELNPYFSIQHKTFFPLPMFPIVNLNLCIGLTLTPK